MPANPTAETVLNKDDLIVVTGAGGFIGETLARRFREQGFTRIRAVDKKSLPEWYQRVPGVESLCMDLSEHPNCVRACEGAAEVYNLAADMGGMGFIERLRVECLRSILINTHMIEAAYRAGVQRYFGDVLPGGLGRARAGDPHRPLPYRVRAVRRLGRRPREGAGRALSQGRIRRLGQSGQDCYAAILGRDVRGLGATMNECMACWEAILPHTVRHPTVAIDLMELLRYYQTRYLGAMYSGSGGGYLYVVAEESAPGGARVKMRVGPKNKTQ